MAIVVVIVVSGGFSFWQEYRAEQTLAGLRKLLPQRGHVLRDGKAVDLPIEQLVPGDVVLLEEGDYIPADCRLIEAFGVRVNTSVITGEPYLAEVAPITGPMYQLFVFFMITDPKTTVRSRSGQMFVAFAVAFVEMLLRLQHVIHAPYYALFLVGPAANVIDIWLESRKAPSPQSAASTRIS